MQGMIASLNDKYTEFLPPSQVAADFPCYLVLPLFEIYTVRQTTSKTHVILRKAMHCGESYIYLLKAGLYRTA